MAKLSYKFSYNIMYVLFAVILIILGMFYGIGYDNPVGEYNAPENTELLMDLIYFMLGLCAAMFFIGKAVNLISLLMNDTKQGLKLLMFDVLIIAVFAIAYAAASDAPLRLADGNIFSDASLLKISDMVIYSSYVLLLVAGFGVLINLVGLCKMFNKIK